MQTTFFHIGMYSSQHFYIYNCLMKFQGCNHFYIPYYKCLIILNAIHLMHVELEYFYYFNLIFNLSDHVLLRSSVSNGRPYCYSPVSFSLLRSSVSLIVILRFLFKVFRFQWGRPLKSSFFNISKTSKNF